MANDGGHPLWGWDNNVSDHEMCTVYKDTTEKLFIMPRGGATAYVLSVCPPRISRHSLKTKR